MTREVPEWCGKDDNTAIPDRVRVRVFLKFEGKCHKCGRKINAGAGESWICDHVQAIINGGANRESNLKPLCEWCDDNVKTPADVAEKSKTYEVRKRHLGIKPKSGRPIMGSKRSGWKRKFDGTVERRK